MMIRNRKINTSYVSTNYVADMLGLSTGTIQKLVDNGHLSAYRTAGGHRRILLDSAIKYSQKNNIPIFSVDVEEICRGEVVAICVLFSEKNISPNLSDIVEDGTFQIFSNPLKLNRTVDKITHIFIDARVEWINWFEMEILSSNIKYLIYNGRILSNPSIREQMERVAILIDADISIELLRGYRLGIKAKDGLHNPRQSAS